MEEVITATRARVHFGELIRRVVERNQTVIVERDGVPQVVVLSVAEYERLRAARPASRRDALERIGRLGDRVLARRGGQPLRPAEDVLADMHEERGADYDRWLGLR
jgi:prevent-host-death family protein